MKKEEEISLMNFINSEEGRYQISEAVKRGTDENMRRSIEESLSELSPIFRDTEGE